MGERLTHFFGDGCIPAHVDLGAEVVMFRCVTCGKWSHASKQPKAHKRWDVDAEPTGPPRGPDDPEGDFVPCGPFVEYRAHCLPASPDEPRR